MQMFMNPCKLYDFMWGTTMHRGTRTTILAPLAAETITVLTWVRNVK